MAWNDDFWKELIETYEAQDFDDNDNDISLTKNKRELAGCLLGNLLRDSGAAPSFDSIYSESSENSSIIDGYFIDYRDDGDCVLHLLSILDYDGSCPQAEKRLDSFVEIEEARDGLVETVGKIFDGSSPARNEEEEEMYSLIQDYKTDISLVNLHVFYWGEFSESVRMLDFNVSNDVVFKVNLWDVARADLVHQNEDSYESFQIEFEDYVEGVSVSAIKVHEESDHYDAYLTSLPADFLADVYEKYGNQLMETNVRDFLQVGGKVNKAIRKTIHENPEKFFIYNNGLCVTAEEVFRDSEAESGVVELSGLQGMQIVNGGQTVASLWRAKYREQADLSSIWVQVKLTEIFGENHGVLVHEISRYSNSQNAVNEADFASSAKIHHEIEEFSKSIIASTDTYWFYERSRGQYNVALNNYKSGTAGDKRVFKSLYPSKQKIDKLLMARWHFSYESNPVIIGKGRQACFLQFMADWASEGEPSVDQQYFKDLVVKGIVYTEATKICKAVGIAAYKSAIVDLVTSLLWKNYRKEIDLNVIWENQDAGEAIKETLTAWIPQISEEFRSSAASSIELYGTNTDNPREWAKKQKCWEHISEWAQRVDLRAHGPLENAKIEHVLPGGIKNEEDRELFISMQLIKEKAEDANTWKEMIDWGNANIGEFNLTEDRRSGQCLQSMIAGTVMGYLVSGRKISVKQANRVIQLIDAYDSKC